MPSHAEKGLEELSFLLKKASHVRWFQIVPNEGAVIAEAQGIVVWYKLSEAVRRLVREPRLCKPPFLINPPSHAKFRRWLASLENMY